MKKHMHLALDVSWTQVETTWREPSSRMALHYPDVGLFEDIARIAERGFFDLIFFGDSTGIPNTWKGSIEDAVRFGVIRCAAATRPESAVKPTCRGTCSIDAIDPTPTFALCQRRAISETPLSSLRERGGTIIHFEL